MHSGILFGSDVQHLNKRSFAFKPHSLFSSRYMQSAFSQHLPHFEHLETLTCHFPSQGLKAILSRPAIICIIRPSSINSSGISISIFTVHCSLFTVHCFYAASLNFTLYVTCSDSPSAIVRDVDSATDATCFSAADISGCQHSVCHRADGAAGCGESDGL